MSQIIIKIFITIIFDITMLLVVKTILQAEVKTKILKILMWMILHILVTLILFQTNQYNLFVTLVSIIIATAETMDIFALKFKKALFIAILCGLTTVLPDIIGTSIFTKFTTFEIARNSIGIMICMSILNCIITVGIFQIPWIKKFLRKIIANKKSIKEREILSYSILVFFGVGLLYYFLANIYSLKIEYILSSIVVIIFVVLSFLYSKERSEYDMLMMEYDVLYRCVKEFEEWTENAELNIHEYRNQMSKILDISKEDAVLKIVNKIIKNTEKIDTDMLEQLKNFPKGEIKGLLYYKMIQAKNKKIIINVDIGKGIEKIYKKLKDAEKEDLSKLIGIYVDNAIEAVEKEENKKISIEIYTTKEQFQFVISNSIKKEEIDLEKMYQKGNTSKGKGRGSGLYFAKKIIQGNGKFHEEHYILNAFFIQKISIHVN